MRVLISILVASFVFSACTGSDKRSTGQLIEAVQHGDLASVEVFLNRGVSPDTQTIGGMPVLLVAITNRNKEITVKLLDKGANPNWKDEYQKPLIFHVIERKDYEMLDLLSKRSNIQIDITNELGETPLMIAAKMGDLEASKIFLSAGANPSAIDSSGWTPLLHSCAAPNDAVEVIDAFIAKGATFEARNKWGYNALMIASLHGNKKTVELLLSKGIDKNLTNNAGQSALQLAEAKGHVAVAALLK